MTKTAMILSALRDGPKTGAVLAEVVDDITPYIARTMAKLRVKGLVENLRPGRRLALYALAGTRQP